MDPSNRRLQEAMGKLNQNCSKIDTSYYVAVNDDDNINTTYELGDSENEVSSNNSYYTKAHEKQNFIALKFLSYVDKLYNRFTFTGI